jgi:hypothetical protein
MTLPRQRRTSLPSLFTLALGLALGWGLASTRTPALIAHGGDRWDESILSAGPTFIRYNEGTKVQVAQDALYYLDYRAGKLLGTIPTIRMSVGASKVLDTFAERDLVADFKLDLDTMARPHFLMTTGSMSTGTGGTYGDGWAPLFVLETTTRQVAVYKIQQQMVGADSQIRLDLLELRPFGTKAPAPR